MVVPTVTYRSESRVLNARERGMLQFFDMICLRKVFGVGVIHGIMRERCGNKASPLKSVDQSTSRLLVIWREWLKKNYRRGKLAVNGIRRRGKPRKK